MDQKIVNKAMLFCADYFNKSCHNFGKPVYLHSIKVAMHLINMGYSDTIIVGAVLHDLLEDTDCTSDDIKKEFGEEVAKLVEAVSFNPQIEDKFLQSKLMLDEALAYGKDALIIKCADMYENGLFFDWVTKQDVKEYLVKKYQYFTDSAKDVIGQEPAFKLYQEIAKTIKL